MTAADWARDTARRYRREDPVTATAESVKELGKGVLRRTVDPVLGETIWNRADRATVILVLDACRVDLMREVADEYEWLPAPEEIGSLWSVASCSLDWIDRTFDPDEHVAAGNAAYVTANPFTGHANPDVLSADIREGEDVGYLDEVWRDGWQEIGGVRTVPAEYVTDRFLSEYYADRERGFDTWVAHYMQPHQPFVGFPELLHDGSNLKDLMSEGEEHGGGCVWQKTRKGRFDLDDVWAAYRENLRYVLDDIEARVLPGLPANTRVAITADHGNGTGEWGTWAHPPWSFSPEVRRVPWVEVDASRVREPGEAPRAGEYTPPAAGGADADPGCDAQDAQEGRLRALGYL